MSIDWDGYRESHPFAGSSADAKSLSANEDLHRLYRRIDALALTCQAMWELLRERTGLTDEEIAAKMQDIDIRDGTDDGKMTVTPRQCPACQRTVSSRHDRCLYCGAEQEISKGNVFEG